MPVALVVEASARTAQAQDGGDRAQGGAAEAEPAQADGSSDGCASWLGQCAAAERSAAIGARVRSSSFSPRLNEWWTDRLLQDKDFRGSKGAGGASD